MTDIISRMPNEIVFNIFDFVGAKDLKEARSTCSLWRSLTNSYLKHNHERLQGGLLEVASYIKQLVKDGSIDFPALSEQILSPWLIIPPPRAEWDTLEEGERLQLEKMYNRPDTLRANVYWFGHNKTLQLVKIPKSIDKVYYGRRDIVLNIFN